MPSVRAFGIFWKRGEFCEGRGVLLDDVWLHRVDGGQQKELDDGGLLSM